MPVQKGKKHKRPRGGRADRVAGSSGAIPVASEPQRVTRERSAPRRRGLMGLPLGWKIALGVTMLGAGVIFYFMPQKGTSESSKLIFLAGYCLLAAFYLGSAYRDWRRKRVQ